MARGIMTRLRHPARLIDTVCLLVENHDKPYYDTPQSARKWLNRLGSKNLFYLIKLKKADCLAHDPSYHNRLYRIAGFRRAVAGALRRGDCYSLSRLAVNGRDINVALELEPGRYTREILEYLLGLVIDGEAENNKHDLIELARKYREKG
jgi:tRNA nucleotidyltransferase/poly(A) polymerase